MECRGILYETFFIIIKNVLWGHEENIPEDFDQWQQLVKLAKSHSVMGYVAKYLLQRRKFNDQDSADLRMKLKSFVVSSAMTAERLSKVLVEVVEVLKEGGISPVLLKGPGLAQYYAIPELRQSGDIDLYVGKDAYAASHLLLTKKYGAQTSENIWEDKHFSVIVNDIEIEIHRLCDEHFSRKINNVLQKYADEGLNSSLSVFSIKGVDIDTPEDTFNAFYIFYHLYRHFMTGGVGLRQLCDWGVFLERKRGSIDRTKLKQIIDEMDMVRAWQDFGELLVVYLGMNPQSLPYRDENISSRRLDIIMGRILSEGNFGFERSYFKKRSENYLLNKVVSLFRHMARFLQLFRLYPVSAYWYMMYFMRNAMSKFLKLK